MYIVWFRRDLPIENHKDFTRTTNPGSFLSIDTRLVNNMPLHWCHGEHCFSSCLVAFDLGSSRASWQLVQGRKFDLDGVGVCQYILVISGLSYRYRFNSWGTPEFILKQAGVKLGSAYAHPVVDLKQSPDSVIISFQSLRHGGP